MNNKKAKKGKEKKNDREEDNEKKKVIKLLDKRYAQLAEKNLLAALNG